MSELPPGFQLDHNEAAIPSGFVLDQPSTLTDVAKSIGAGLGNQTLGVLGAPGLIEDTLAHGSKVASDYIANKLGFESSGPVGKSILPTPQDLRDTVTDPIVSPDYQPQTALGKVAKIGSEYSLGLADPAALLSPAGFTRTVGTNIAAPALASEAAGKVFDGTPLERPARIASAFLGGYGAYKGVGALQDAQALKNATIPLNELKPQTSAAYDAIRDANVGKPLPENALSETSDQIVQALNAKNYRPINAPEFHDLAAQIKKPGTEGAPDVADLLAARAAIKDNISTNAPAAFVALDKVEKAIDKYSPGAMDEIRAQDKNWTGVKSTEALDKNLAKAEGSAAAANSGLNLGNRIRQRTDSLLNSPQAKYMSEDVKGQLKQVVDGTATQNTLRSISNYVGKGHGLGGAVAGEIIGHIFGNDLLGVAVGTAVGRGTNSLYTRSIANSAKQAGDFIRRETPAGQQYAANLGVPLSAKAQAFRSGLKGARLENRRVLLPAALAATYDNNR